MASERVGFVSLVGAGPGDPGLLTLEGARRLSQADVVLYDYLANETLLRHAPPTAKLFSLGRHGEGKLWTQGQINERMVAEALAGRSVVRLKGGDPSVFGRMAEEVAACKAAGVPLAIVPGVTAATAAGAYAGVTITDRDHASCVALVTGHERGDGAGSNDALFERLATFPGTLVVYMGVTTAPAWSRTLMDAGKPPDTPVAIVRRCSLPDQQTIHCTLAEIPEVLAPQRIRPPLVVILGEVARDEAAGWFAARPLFGETVLVTRPAGQGGALTERLEELGARVLSQPAIEIVPPADPELLADAAERLGAYDWVVFSSRNGVAAVLDRVRDVRAFGAARVAAVGTATAEALAAGGLRADLVPDEHNAEALAVELAPQAEGKRFLLVRAGRGRDVLAESLAAAGGEVDSVVAYDSRDVAAADEQVLAEAAAGRIDWVTVTSPSIARSAARLLGDAIADAGAAPRFAAISPLTAEALADAGHAAAVVAETATAEGLVESILAAESHGS